MKSDKERQFEALVRQYKRTIYSVCYMFSRDTEEVNDLFQEILIRLWGRDAHAAQDFYTSRQRFCAF